MKSSSLPYWLTLVVVLAAGYGFARNWRAQLTPGSGPPGQGAALTIAPTLTIPGDEKPLSEFTLTERSGDEFHSGVLQGEVWVASFFFSQCPSACRMLNQGLQRLQEQRDLDEVKFVSITCDPDNDTPEVLREYAQLFRADPQRWFFCTGEFDYIKRIGTDMMKVAVDRQMHANHAIVIDRAGKVRGRFNVLEPHEVAAMKQKLQECLAEPAPAEPEETANREGTLPEPQEKTEAVEAAVEAKGSL